MNSKIVLAALSLALVLNGSAAFAGGKKQPADPRINLITLKKASEGGWQTWSDIDSHRNGWDQALSMANQGKLKY